MMKSHLKNFIFDFDGTIADTMSHVYQALNEVHGDFGFKKINLEDLDRLRGLPTREVFKESKLSLWKLPKISKKVKEILFTRMEKIKPFNGLTEVLFSLKKENLFLGIVTSNHLNNVERFLAMHDLDCFNAISTDATVFGKAKMLKRFMKKNQLSKSETIYVGDETRDIEAAKKVGIKVISVSWGYNHASVLSEFNPEYLIHSPQELLSFINGRLKKKS